MQIVILKHRISPPVERGEKLTHEFFSAHDVFFQRVTAPFSLRLQRL